MLIMAVVSLLVGWAVMGLQGSVLILHNGTTLTADETWTIGDRVFYKNGIAVKTLASSDVEQIVTAAWTNPACYRPLLSAHFRNTLAAFQNSRLPGTGADQAGHPLPVQLKPFLPVLVFGLLALLLILLAIRKKKSNQTEKAVPGQPQAIGFAPRLADFSDIESLFLNLYKKKLRVPASAPAAIERTPQKGSGPGEILNLEVHHGGKSHSRRMSLAPIGEGSGSKSQCFYVIFDTHIVVKIPPSPITEFEVYLEKVQAETRIMRALEPKVCVIPNLAVILSRIHVFPEADQLSPSQLERRYIRWLRENPENQRFLTIGGKFVFFMDLARYFFLSHVAAGFHGRDSDLVEAIRADIDILTDFNLFEDKYGRQGGELWPGLHTAYKNFQARLNGAMAQADETVAFSKWNVKELFLSSMAGLDTELAGLQSSPAFTAFMGKRIAPEDESETQTRHRYQQLLKQQHKNRLFSRSRPLMGTMVTNLLALLAWLDEKQVGLRDLKPDNLLVAGNPDDYPHFLTSAKDYAIGLIDLETAVDYGNLELSEIPQPQLGGTPFYCTPSHFFPNNFLQQFYGDLPLVFHLQDWYATIAIIFEVVTGKQLFKNTAFQIPMMMKTVMQTAAQKGDLKKKFLHFSRQFHDNAKVETREKFKLHTRRLKAVSANIPEYIQPHFVAQNKRALAAAEAEIKHLLDTTAAFNRGNNRRRLEKSSLAELKKLRTGYTQQTGTEKLVSLIEALIQRKQTAVNLDRAGRKLATPFPRFTAGELLEMMFDRVQTQLFVDLALPELEDARQIPEAGLVDDAELAATAAMLGYSVTIPL